MENIHEKVSSSKVQERIKQDGYEAGKKAIQEVTKSLTDRGFNKTEIEPLIRSGVKKAYQELSNK